jgi:hypothetical protein
MKLQVPSYIHGESLYSYAARIHHLSASPGWKATNEAVFGKAAIRLHPTLPAHISALARFSRNDPLRLLYQGTAYPLAAMTLPPRAKVRLEKEMYSDSGRDIDAVSRIAASRLSAGGFHRLCPKCIEADRQQLGMGYWHTAHQLSGVLACPEHGCRLAEIRSGEGGLNRRLELPEVARGRQVEAVPAEVELARYMGRLRSFLCAQSPLTHLPSVYKAWLLELGFLTAKGSVRWRRLKPALQDHWRDLFQLGETRLPNELNDFCFVPTIVHGRHCVHYLKHTLLMAFLSPSPESFFSPPTEVAPASTTMPRENEPSVDDLKKALESGESIKVIAKRCGRSTGYIRQLTRNSIPLPYRPRRVTPEVEQEIWKKAACGVHRRDIALGLNISVASVEAAIQRYPGLSEWRRHLAFEKKSAQCRKELANYISEHPGASRQDIKRNTKAYMWLYKHDRAWLYAQLPARQNSNYKPGVDWMGRDKELFTRLEELAGPYRSISEVDRLLGGHGWLSREKHRLPRSYERAIDLRS